MQAVWTTFEGLLQPTLALALYLEIWPTKIKFGFFCGPNRKNLYIKVSDFTKLLGHNSKQKLVILLPKEIGF